jgi:hypothetical protein
LGTIKANPRNGVDSHLSIRGKYDLLVEFPDGTYGIIDCKMQARTSDKSGFYSPQLEAYAYALENPAKGEPKEVSMIGIYSWSLPQAWGNVNAGFGYRVNSNWYPAERNPQALQSRLEEFISMINGECPPPKDGCEHLQISRRARGDSQATLVFIVRYPEGNFASS